MRKRTELNEKWYFLKGDTLDSLPPRYRDKSWAQVELPHSWNSTDGHDGGNDYYRGIGWYCKEIYVSLEQGEKAFLEFPGVSLACEVFVNGVRIAAHDNGFSTFYAELTPLLGWRGKALLAIRVDNGENLALLPQNPAYTCFGGLFRSPYLLKLSASHFAIGSYGSCGVSVTPVLNENGSADVIVQTVVLNAQTNQTLVFTLKTGDDVTVPVFKRGVVLHLPHPHLWNGTLDPFLYTLEVRLEDASEILDNIKLQFGIRSFHMDPEQGFFLNGQPYPLHGVCRQQDRAGKGWALTHYDHAEDMKLLLDMGANAVHLGHYQHDPYFYTICDRTGMIVWAETAFEPTDSSAAPNPEHTQKQLKELVLQHYNHPSIICWGLANNRMHTPPAEELAQALRALNATAHELDKTRLTAIANSAELPAGHACNFVSDLVGTNLSHGWDYGETKDAGQWLDDFHKQNPLVCLGISEYGCAGVTQLHGDKPRAQDFTEEYQTQYHEQMLQLIEERPYLWASFVSELCDYADDALHEGGQPGICHKGLVSYDRLTKKDAFYLYKARWSEDPFVYICAKRFADRTKKHMDVTVYSNCESVTLYVNKQEYAVLEGETVFRFANIPLEKGENLLRACAGDLEDVARFYRVDQPNAAYSLG